MSVFVATETGTLTLPDGSVIDIRKDVTRVREGHPALAAHPIFFTPADEHPAYEWEQATAAPAEKRKRASKPEPVADVEAGEE